ncbi:serine/threonine-protein phosphatase [Streptomyces sp. NBC_01685]|uniref:PP2C family protein-serine/threonine phosphatase n=1 Tax=Streptomyces sp. NBC_01685 TaxID=2975910 RepID=UPI002E32C3DD|nr:PP2C family protein-serine/threonine phosphatase [Streptomyces sp. NBC_01685]
MFNGFLDASHGLSLERLPALVRDQAAHAGLHEASIYLADLQEDVLRLVTGHGLDAADSVTGQGAHKLRIDGTPAGRAFTQLTPQHDQEAHASCWWTPLLDGAERVGVLRVETDDTSEQTARLVQRLATLITLLILSVRSHSDAYSRLVRTRPMTVAAVLQWNLMPPRAFANGRVTISAALEPAYEVGGDAYDYALADDMVHLGVFDAMGHDVAAGLTANMAVAACRNARRQNTPLIETGEFIERTLVEQLGNDRYVTAALLDLDTRTGEITWTNHAHHSPVVVRDGTWTHLLPCPPSHPLGTGLGIGATMCREQLNPGDRLVLYTDGITEARSPAGEEFGLQRFMGFVLAHNAEGLPVPETLRRLIHGVLDYQKGQLQDDATVLFLEWHGPRPASPETPGALRSPAHEPTPSHETA